MERFDKWLLYELGTMVGALLGALVVTRQAALDRRYARRARQGY